MGARSNLTSGRKSIKDWDTGMNSRNEPGINLKRIGLITLAVYIVLVIGFYFLAGEQLLYRDSRGDLVMPSSDAAAAELSQGVTVEQVFQAKIQRLETVSVQWGSYYRPNSGTVTMELILLSDGTVLMEGSFDAASITEGQYLSISAAEPVEAVYDTPLLLRLYADSPVGSAATPLVNTQGTREGFALTVNGEPVPGMLCFSAAGTDYIWTGTHYWEFVAAVGLLLVLFFLIVGMRYRNGKRSYLVNALIAVKKYRFLIRQLVSRDFKTKYKRSVLGIFWSFLNPLLTMLVQYVVFSTLFKNDIPNFAAYLIIGTVMFNFFSEACGMTLSSILGNANLITKVYIPKYIYPLTRTMSSAVNLLTSLGPLLIVCLATGVVFKKSAVLALCFFACLIVFSLGLGMLLATLMVFFRDTQFLWNVLTMIWMYATPIFYPETILPDNIRIVLRFNPLYHFLQNARMCILDGVSPEPAVYFLCLAMALGMLLLGAVVFYREQDKFVLYM